MISGGTLQTKSTYTLIDKYQAVVNNGRQHAVLMDLPAGKGDDIAPTALEYLVMSLAGCIGTIYKVVADKMRLKIQRLKVDLEAEKGEDDPTVKAVHATVYVKTNAPMAKLEKCLDLTMKTCPVGALYEKANIPMDVKVNLIEEVEE
ncbi:MAG: OsmC family protein [Candidatus Heimdallarchaeota archaeon]